MGGPSSRISGFYKQTMQERRQVIASFAGLSEAQLASLSCGLGDDQADHMIENVVGTFNLPLGIASNFLINGRETLVPMVTEEPSVVAGASFAARLVRAGGGFQANADPPWMIGQIQVLDLPDVDAAAERVLADKRRLIDLANATDPVIVRLNGGARDIEVRAIRESPCGQMLIVHLLFDCRDAMGANMVNTACESLAPTIEQLTGGRVNLRILSNLADRRLARAKCRVPAEELTIEGMPGSQVGGHIVEAYALAASDPYRAATHNKGIMNGIDAVVIATGNDWRAVEAGAHAYAARTGAYRSLSTWSQNKAGDLLGALELPMAVGTVGGATRVHPAAQAAMRVLGVGTASELAQVIVSVGLAQNLAAIRALATEGIQRGHMALHARQVAIAAGAQGNEIEVLAARMVSERTVRSDRAEDILKQLRLRD